MKAAGVHGARAEFCCRSGAVGAMKAAEVHGARAGFAAVAGTWREDRVLLPERCREHGGGGGGHRGGSGSGHRGGGGSGHWGGSVRGATEVAVVNGA